jgi:predicted RNase H-like HicB family nuclease
MIPEITLEYWLDEEWYVGRLRGIPGVFSQGKTLDELEENIRDAYQMMLEDDPPPTEDVHTKEIGVPV